MSITKLNKTQMLCSVMFILYHTATVQASPCEEGALNFNDIHLEPYKAQDVDSIAIPVEDGCSLYMTGNTWVQTSEYFEFTPNSVLSFGYQSNTEGEIHAIGFERNGQPLGNEFFTLTGSQADIFGLRYLQYNTVGQYQKFSIKLGGGYIPAATGTPVRIVFVMDQDIDTGGDAYFDNVKITTPEPTPTPIPTPTPTPPMPTPIFDIADEHCAAHSAKALRAQTNSQYSYQSTRNKCIGTASLTDSGEPAPSLAFKKIGIDYDIGSHDGFIAFDHEINHAAVQLTQDKNDPTKIYYSVNVFWHHESKAVCEFSITDVEFYDREGNVVMTDPGAIVNTTLYAVLDSHSGAWSPNRTCAGHFNLSAAIDTSSLASIPDITNIERATAIVDKSGETGRFHRDTYLGESDHYVKQPIALTTDSLRWSPLNEDQETKLQTTFTNTLDQAIIFSEPVKAKAFYYNNAGYVLGIEEIHSLDQHNNGAVELMPGEQLTLSSPANVEMATKVNYE